MSEWYKYNRETYNKDKKIWESENLYFKGEVSLAHTAFHPDIEMSFLQWLHHIKTVRVKNKFLGIEIKTEW